MGSTRMEKLLVVDLNNKTTTPILMERDMAERFIGGWGVNAALAKTVIPPGIDALYPNMPIIIGAGLLSGTLAPGASKAFLTTKCPATGTVSTAVGSGYFAAKLKWSGISHLIISGKSSKPVYLYINSEEANLIDARELWGKDIAETTNILKERHGRDASVVCIGPAGERGVNIAIVLIDNCSTFGRTNGASLGSKNLKAIVVKGGSGVQVSDNTAFMSLVEKLEADAKSDALRNNWIEQGLYYIFPNWAKLGYFTCRNGTETFPEEKALQLFGPDRFLKLKSKVICCPTCITPDKYLLKIGKGKYAGTSCPISTPITPAWSFGIRSGVEDMNGVIRLHQLANQLGIDEMTFSGIFDYLACLQEENKLSDKDTDGVKLKREFRTVERLLLDTAMKKGLGSIIGQGWHGVLKHFGSEVALYATHIKGTEPDFDPRISFGVECFTAVTNPRGAHDMPAGGLMIAPGRKLDFFKKMALRMGFPENRMNSIFNDENVDLGRFTAHYENWATVLNCLGICFRMQVSKLYDIDTCAALYSAATGIEKDADELVEDAERAYNQYRVVNAREGFNRKNDRFPPRWLEPLKRAETGEKFTIKDYINGKDVGSAELEQMLDSYYEERGWDKSTGVPTLLRLKELGLRR